MTRDAAIDAMNSETVRSGVWRPTICLVAELPPPTGGMAVQAQRLGANLRAEGYPVIHVPTNALAQQSSWRRIKGLRGAINLLLFFGSMISGVARAQVVHIFSNSFLSFFLFTAPTVSWARLLGRRVVIHYHGGGADRFLEHWSQLALPVLRAGCALIVPSGFLVEVFAKHGLAARVVSNTLMLEDFRYSMREPLRARVLMARHLQPVYNIACGIRAFAKVAARIDDAQLTIAGAGPERESLGQLCRELRVEQRVRFVGNIDNKSMQLLFEASHILLNTSRVDNQPVSILEAFASGLAVVSTAVGGIPYMVSHGEDGLLAPDNDDEALAAQMLELLRNPTLARALVEQGHRRALEYSWTSVYPTLAAIYAGGARE